MEAQERSAISTDDFSAAMTTGGAIAIIGLLLWFLARRLRTTHYVDNRGNRVAEDGAALEFMMINSALSTFDEGDNSGEDFD